MLGYCLLLHTIFCFSSLSQPLPGNFTLHDPPHHTQTSVSSPCLDLLLTCLPVMAVSYSADPTLYLYTSLTAGSSHIITATSRLETILKANKIPFRALDCATDEKARMLWGRRSKGRKLPGLVKYGTIIGVKTPSGPPQQLPLLTSLGSGAN